MSTSQIYTISRIAEIIKAEYIPGMPEMPVEHLLTDSRRLLNPQTTLFFALKAKKDGHLYVPELYEKGVRNFVISDRSVPKNKFVEANFLLVEDTLVALQDLAAYHRRQFSYPVVGITGSNGKTTVKEWLYQALSGSSERSVLRSPRSYNSQIGVALSVWNMAEEYNLALFEAGISKPGEMEKLEQIIKPDIGILTNIGAAHDEGFRDRNEKITEKLKLFKDVKLLIYNPAYFAGYSGPVPGIKKFTWSFDASADLRVKDIRRHELKTTIEWTCNQLNGELEVPFTDAASIENVMTCTCLLFHFDFSPDEIAELMSRLQPVAMRMELKKAINNCLLVNDSYSADLDSLPIALDFLDQQQEHRRKTVILSDILQSGRSAQALYKHVAKLLAYKGIDRLIGIGKQISAHAELFQMEKTFYPDTKDFIKHFSPELFHNEAILLKGARIFEFEKISRLLEQKVHETILGIDLDAMIHNLNVYRSHLKPGTKIMAMVKAFSYGSGSAEVARLLMYSRVDYLAVAYADEGTDLKAAGIHTPVMVMSPEESAFDAIISTNLEPQLYNFRVFEAFVNALKDKNIKEYPVHLKLDTGMKRLGFEQADVPKLEELLRGNEFIRVKSIFSHLAASDERDQDAFTQIQIALFDKLSSALIESLGYPVMRHIANTAAILRFPEAQYDMVRLGIGLYGIDSSGILSSRLLNVGTLKTTITQVKDLSAGETVGYGRHGKASGKRKIATIKIGYADGYSRLFSRGKGYVMIKGKPAPVIGNVCMDMTMVDITGIDAHEGDEVIVFGEKPAIAELAAWAGTIPYEILTNVSQRVKRVYYYE